MVGVMKVIKFRLTRSEEEDEEKNDSGEEIVTKKSHLSRDDYRVIVTWMEVPANYKSPTIIIIIPCIKNRCHCIAATLAAVQMTRAAAWNSLDDRWQTEWQAHRNRLSFIQSANSVSAQACSSALAASSHPRRLHTSRSSWNSSSPVKLIARSKSPAVKSRQKQIEHDNLVLIKKIIAIDNAKVKKPKTKRKQRCSTTSTAHSSDRNAIIVPKPAHSDHECLRTLADVPPPSSHALYTRSSATMKNNFVEYNAPTMFHSSNFTSAAARVRSRAQSKILDENKKILRRILSARTTVDRSELERHGERHSKLRTIMSRHNSTSKLPQQSHERSLRTSRSQVTLHRDNSDSGIRTDSVSHLKSRPRSASQAVKPHTARRSSESLVSRIRNMTMESQGK